MQNQDFNFFYQNMENLYKTYGNKFIAIKNTEILGAYNSFDIALHETLKEQKIGTFFIQECFETENPCVQESLDNVIPTPP